MSKASKRVGDVQWYSSNKHSISFMAFESLSKVYRAIKFVDNDNPTGRNDVVSYSESTGKTVNTWEDWGLISDGPQFFTMPKTKTQYVDLAGLDGSIAVTSFGTKTRYANRTGTLDFIFDRSIGRQTGGYYRMYEKIVNWLHGTKCLAILEDDPNYIYEGEFQIDSFSPDEDFYTLKMSYNVKPFKYNRFAIGDRWLWDPFNFGEKTPIPGDYYLPNAFNSTISGLSERTQLFAMDQNLLGYFKCTTLEPTQGSPITTSHSVAPNTEVFLGEAKSNVILDTSERRLDRRYLQVGCYIPGGTFKRKAEAPTLDFASLHVCLDIYGVTPGGEEVLLRSGEFADTAYLPIGSTNTVQAGGTYVFSLFNPNIFIGGDNTWTAYKFGIRFFATATCQSTLACRVVNSANEQGYVTISYRSKKI